MNRELIYMTGVFIVFLACLYLNTCHISYGKGHLFIITPKGLMIIVSSSGVKFYKGKKVN